MDINAQWSTPEFRWNIYEKLGYSPIHPDVLRFHNSNARVKVSVCPRRASKSYYAAKDVLPLLFKPNGKVWIVGPDYYLAEKEFRYLHDDMMALTKMGLPGPTICHTSPKSGGLFIKWPWGATLEGKTAENPRTLLGEAVDAIVYSEAAQLPNGIRERYTQPTLITTRGREIIPTTPDSRAEWVYQLWERGMVGDMPEIETFSWDITANPTYPKEEFELAKKMYGAESPEFKEQYLGEWVFYTGLVYPMFNKDLHVIEPFKIPDNWPRYRAIDFGARDPFVCLWAAVGPEREIYFYREYYEKNPSIATPQHVEKIKQLTGNESISNTVADPSGAQLRNDLIYHGLSPVKAGDNDRTLGRRRVMEYMTPNTDGVPPWNKRDKRSSRDKWPRMYIFNTLQETVNELKFYRWKESRQIEGDKERTEGSDHGVDCLRYLLMERPSPKQELMRTPVGSFEYYRKKGRFTGKKGSIRGNAYGY